MFHFFRAKTPSASLPPYRLYALLILAMIGFLSVAASCAHGKATLPAGMKSSLRLLKMSAPFRKFYAGDDGADAKKYKMRVLPPNPNLLSGRLMDSFGQYTGADWPGKLHNAGELATRRAAEEAALAKAPQPPGTDRFGGWTGGPALTATGYFRTVQNGGKWWLVDPDGHLFFSIGMDAVDDSDTYGGTTVTGRDAMFSALAEPGAVVFGHMNAAPAGVTPGTIYNFYAANLERKYGPAYHQAWQQNALARLKSWGFNTLGNWSDLALAKQDAMPYVARLAYASNHAHVPTSYQGWAPMDDPFDPKFAADVAATFPRRVQPYKNDPYCIGYFLANEMSWVGTGPYANQGLAIGTLGLDASASPAKQALLAQLQKKYMTINALDTAWQTNFPSWAAMGASWQAPPNLTDAMVADLNMFVLTLARQYFHVVDSILKSLDPHHLDLGCRFAHFTPEAAQACAENCDVVSFNIYQNNLDKWAWLTGLNKPCLVGEFHFGARDRGLFWGGMVDAGSQAGRASAYTAYMQSALRHPAIVGCHWYEYADQPVTGALFDGENGNVGFVDVTDTPYPELVQAAQTVNLGAYALRSTVK